MAATVNASFGAKMGLENQHIAQGCPNFVAFDCKGSKVPHDDGGGPLAIATPWAVRRLTPVECERLMGFPDDWTQIPWRGKPAEQCPDGRRYKALGNSWGVNCGEYIFDRMRWVESL